MGGSVRGGEVAQTMNTHTSKCENDKIKSLLIYYKDITKKYR
jgi:hypothetical protein